jgi:hypothetical protein
MYDGITSSGDDIVMLTTEPPVTPATRRSLFAAFEHGRRISLWDNGLRRAVAGPIQAIRLESGYVEGTAPQHLLVSVLEDNGRVREVYVRTY